MADIKDLYDFTDTSDLPQNLQNKLASGGGQEPALVAQITEIVNKAPGSLTLAQIIAVATRMGIELPAETTVRSYVNRAVADGRIIKVTRQSYGSPLKSVEEAPVEAPVEDADDPLAGL